MQIKTVYLQHASVTTIYPALSVSYAFLDGKYAMEIYKQCDINRFGDGYLGFKSKVLLTGQKKIIYKSKDTEKKVGITLNVLDDLEKVITLVVSIAKSREVIIRWHPTQPKSDVDKLLNYSFNNNKIKFSNPLKESVSFFLMDISYLVAGNSSIHLEAALAHVLTIYYEFTEQKHPDYYDYVKNGLAQQANSIDEIQRIIQKGTSTNKELENAINHYSATYKTSWEGHEGELVAQCLEAIFENRELPVPILPL